jgi:predicted ArsR family transcriptional regulator
MSLPAWHSSRPLFSRRKGQSGLTLVELVVMILLAAILLAGLHAMTAGQSRTYNDQLAGLNVQQNIWGAMEHLQRQLRLAGYGFGGCPGGVINKWSGSGDGVVPAETMAFRGFNNCSLHATSGDTYPPPRGSCPALGSDSFAVAFSSGAMSGSLSAVRLSREMPESSAALWTRACSGVKQGDLLVLWEPGSRKPCTMIQATRTPSACTPRDRDCRNEKKSCMLPHKPGGQSAYNPPRGANIFPPGGYARGALVVNLGAREAPLKLSIDRSGPVPRLVQWRLADRSDQEVIAEGIEDMQVSWACDRNGNGELEEGADAASRRSDEWAHNVAGDVSPCQVPAGCVPPGCTRTLAVSAVRITRIGRPGRGRRGAPPPGAPGGGGRGGRPHLYSLTPKGRALFPHHYDEFTNSLLREILVSEGPEKVQELLGRLGRRMAEPYERQLSGVPPSERAAKLTELLNAKGILAEIKFEPEGVVVHEYTCPYYELARENRAICDMEEEMLAHAVQQPVALITCTLDGHHGCQFRIETRLAPQSSHI